MYLNEIAFQIVAIVLVLALGWDLSGDDAEGRVSFAVVLLFVVWGVLSIIANFVMMAKG